MVGRWQSLSSEDLVKFAVFLRTTLSLNMTIVFFDFMSFPFCKTSGLLTVSVIIKFNNMSIL